MNKNSVSAGKEHRAVPSSESLKTSELDAALQITGDWRAWVAGQSVLAREDQMMIANVRGWGYLTGTGALNLSEKEAVKIQDALTHLIAAAPALYETLQAITSAMPNPPDAPVGPEDEWGVRPESINRITMGNIRRARAALALARGDVAADKGDNSR